jgi:hypothetical protein
MDNGRDRVETDINQKTRRKLSVYFELYEGAWISANSSGVWGIDWSEISVICFFQNQAVGKKRIYSQDSSIVKSNGNFIVRWQKQCRNKLLLFV